MEYLLFKLITLKLLSVADERRFIEKAASEAERVVDSLRQAEERRAAALAVVAGEWDVRVDELSLSRLALEAPEPAAKQSRDLQRSLHGLADEIDAVTDENRRLAEGGLGDVHSLLDTVVGSTTGDIFTQMGRRHRARASLDGRARVTGAAAGFATARAELVGNTEDLLGEPDAGVQQQALLGVFDAFDELALDPSNMALRDNVIASFDALGGRIRSVAAPGRSSPTMVAPAWTPRSSKPTSSSPRVDALNRDIAAGANPPTPRSTSATC